MYGDAFGGKTAPVVSEIANTTRLGGRALYKIRIFVPTGWANPVGGDDWRHIADIA